MELREFKYKTHDEIKERKLYVLQENDKNVAGLDYNLLTEDDRKNVEIILKDYTIRSIGNKEPIDGWDTSWGKKAWRCFTKANFIKDEVIKES